MTEQEDPTIDEVVASRRERLGLGPFDATRQERRAARLADVEAHHDVQDGDHDGR